FSSTCPDSSVTYTLSLHDALPIYAVEDRGLAGAVGSDQPVDAARLDREADAVHGAQPAEVQRQVVDRQHRALLYLGARRRALDRAGKLSLYVPDTTPAARGARCYSGGREAVKAKGGDLSARYADPTRAG